MPRGKRSKKGVPAKKKIVATKTRKGRGRPTEDEEELDEEEDEDDETALKDEDEEEEEDDEDEEEEEEDDDKETLKDEDEDEEEDDEEEEEEKEPKAKRGRAAVAPSDDVVRLLTAISGNSTETNRKLDQLIAVISKAAQVSPHAVERATKKEEEAPAPKAAKKAKVPKNLKRMKKITSFEEGQTVFVDFDDGKGKVACEVLKTKGKTLTVIVDDEEADLEPADWPVFVEA